MSKFYKIMVVLLTISALNLTFNQRQYLKVFGKLTDNDIAFLSIAKDLNDRLSQLENKDSTVHLFIEQHYSSNEDKFNWKVVDYFETPNKLKPAH